jgi:hypothetical protein
MSTPSFLNKDNNASVPVSFLAKETSTPTFLGKQVEAKSLIRVKADFALAQLVWFHPADLDLRSVYKDGSSVQEAYYGQKQTKYATLNEDSGVSGQLEYDINPYTNQKENCFSELLYMGNAQEQHLMVNFYSAKQRGYDNFASLEPLARLVLLEEVSPAKEGGFLGMGGSAAVLKPVHYIDVIFDSGDNAATSSSNKWLDCFKIINDNDGFYSVEYVGEYSSSKANPNLASTPRERVAKKLPRF